MTQLVEHQTPEFDSLSRGTAKEKVGLGTSLIFQLIFFVIILFKLYFEHVVGAICLIWLLATCFRVNSLLQEGFRGKEVGTTLWKSFIASLFSVLCAGLMLYLFRNEGIYKIFFMLPISESPIGWMSTFWVVALVDCSIKLFGAFLKNLVLLIPASCLDVYRMRWAATKTAVNLQLFRGR